MRISYAQSLPQRLYTLVIIPLIAIVVTVVCIQTFASHAVPSEAIGVGHLFAALGATFARLAIAYCLALAVALPLALLVTHDTFAERIFLPLFDVMQSLPVLAFFPVIILFFVHYGFYSGAAIFVLFVTMLWSIVFSLVGGLHSIPQDIKDAGAIFGLRGSAYAEKILLPAAVPYLVTGSLLAWAGGWNIIIVAEVLHTYLPAGQAGLPATASSDLFGIGSILVNAAASGQQQTFVLAVIVLVAAIALLNFFVWQKLLKYAETFKFE
jgi:NitT/TauT family transport system permease protein